MLFMDSLFKKEPEKAPIILTSPGRFDGKTVVACNLAVSLARSGFSTLLADCNLHSPGVASFFEIPDFCPGLGNMLELRDGWRSCIYEACPNLHIIPAGTLPRDPALYLDKPATHKALHEMAAEYDFVLLDTPCIKLSSDPLILAKLGGHLFFVVRHNSTRKNDLAQSIHVLDTIGCNISGIIYNDVPVSRSDLKISYTCK